jgi:ankyrin repeat protein
MHLRQDGSTALTCSAKNDHINITQLLLESKADIHTADKVFFPKQAVPRLSQQSILDPMEAPLSYSI